MLYSISSKQERMWRNWYTRTFEGRVALPCEFESRHPHFLQIIAPCQLYLGLISKHELLVETSHCNVSIIFRKYIPNPDRFFVLSYK